MLVGTGQTFHDPDGSPDSSFASRCVSWAKALVPTLLKRWVRKELRRFSVRPPLGWVRFGTLRRLTPISPIFGLERGQSIATISVPSCKNTTAISGGMCRKLQSLGTRISLVETG